MRTVFLTVADSHTGLGHLYRCDALATALAEKGADVSLLVDCRAGREWLASRAPENPWIIQQWTDDPETTMATIANADRVIVDAYDIEDTVRKTISETVPDPVYFDDYGSNIPERGIVINGSPGAYLIDYPERPGLVLFLGPQYQVLRKPFWQSSSRTIRERVELVGVMLGGTDHRGLIDQVLPVVRYAVGSEATVYAIGVEPDAIRHAGVKATGRLTAQQMKELFDGLDLLVTAAGQTVAEAVSCELPTVMIQTAENQTYNVEGLLQSQAAVAGGTIEDFVKGKTSHILTDISRQVTARANMAQICKKLRLDRSTDRVAMIIMDQQ